MFFKRHWALYELVSKDKLIDNNFFVHPRFHLNKYFESNLECLYFGSSANLSPYLVKYPLYFTAEIKNSDNLFDHAEISCNDAKTRRMTKISCRQLYLSQSANSNYFIPLPIQSPEFHNLEPVD